MYTNERGVFMELNLGYVQDYKKKGFGFVKASLNDDDPNQVIYFHISSIKYRYPLIYQKLEDKKYKNIIFWYTIRENKKGKYAEEVWCDFNDVPDTLKTQFLDSFRSTAFSIPPDKFDKSDLIKILPIMFKGGDYLDFMADYQFEKTADKTDVQIHIRKNKEATQVAVLWMGLPEELHEEVFKVTRPYRKHPWSFIPGGADVVVEYRDGNVRLYDWIKYPDLYIRRFFNGIIHYPELEQIAIAKSKISRIFSRVYKDEVEREITIFEEVWNCEYTNTTPWEALKQFKVMKDQENTDSKYL
jgi:cold shock CspA family protein